MAHIYSAVMADLILHILPGGKGGRKQSEVI